MFDSYSMLTLAPLVREVFEVKNGLSAGYVNLEGWATISDVVTKLTDLPSKATANSRPKTGPM